MTSNSLDVDDDYPKNAPNLVLKVMRYLLGHGYGALRFYSYIQNGISVLRVAMYFEMKEQGRNGKPLAIPLFLESFSGFTGMGSSGLWRDCMSKKLPISYAARVFEENILEEYGNFRSEPSIEYLTWFDSLVANCSNNGFPITEEPCVQAYGADGEMVECVFDDHSRVEYLPRPPRFSETIFPYSEYSKWKRYHDLELAETKDKTEYAEWKRKVATIR